MGTTQQISLVNKKCVKFSKPLCNSAWHTKQVLNNVIIVFVFTIIIIVVIKNATKHLLLAYGQRK